MLISTKTELSISEMDYYEIKSKMVNGEIDMK